METEQPTLTTHAPQIWGEICPLNLGGGLSKNTCFTARLSTHRSNLGRENATSRIWGVWVVSVREGKEGQGFLGKMAASWYGY